MATGEDRRSAVLRRALRNGRLRRVLLAYLMFNVQEWATWIALLVWAYAIDGVRGASAIALVQLVPSALLASPAAVLLDRLPRTRALPLGYSLQAATQLVLAAVLLLDLPFVAVAAAAAVAATAITLTRPAHHALLPEISETTGELTVGNTASGTVEAAAAFIGPLVCGGLLSVWQPGGVVLVMATALRVPAWRLRAARPGRGPAGLSRLPTSQHEDELVRCCAIPTRDCSADWSRRRTCWSG